CRPSCFVLRCGSSTSSTCRWRRSSCERPASWAVGRSTAEPWPCSRRRTRSSCSRVGRRTGTGCSAIFPGWSTATGGSAGLQRQELERVRVVTHSRSILVTATVAAAMCVAASGCGGSTDASGSTQVKKTLRVALIGPQSGQLASLGDWDYKGVTLAAKQINAAGGAGGLKIQITRMDDQGDPTTGGELAQKAVSDHYDVIFGSSSSTITLAMLPVATRAKIPEITSGQADALTKQGSAYIFLDSPTSTTYDATLAKYVLGTLGKKGIAMITNNGAYGKGEHNAFLAQLTQHGLKPVADKVITPDQKD